MAVSTAAPVVDSEEKNEKDIGFLEEEIEEDELSAGAIVGIVIGSLAGIAIIGYAAFVMGGRDATKKCLNERMRPRV